MTVQARRADLTAERQVATAFPGATGVTWLDVYDWPAPDGLRGGSAHVHFASTEGYVVTGGTGRLQTLGSHGYADVPLRPGDCLWFTPGVIHRLVNDGDLRILVVMQNAGLPEAGDCVMTFPSEVLSDRDRYAAAVSLTAAGEDMGESYAARSDVARPDGSRPEGARLEGARLEGSRLEGARLEGARLEGARPEGARPDADGSDAARRRRDLAIEGFLSLRDRVRREGPQGLEEFFAAALRLVAGKVPQWRERWRAQAASVAALTGEHLDDIEALRPGHLLTGSLHRLPRLDEPRRFGMCGRLTVYDVGQASIIETSES